MSQPLPTPSQARKRQRLQAPADASRQTLQRPLATGLGPALRSPFSNQSRVTPGSLRSTIVQRFISRLRPTPAAASSLRTTARLGHQEEAACFVSGFPYRLELGLLLHAHDRRHALGTRRHLAEQVLRAQQAIALLQHLDHCPGKYRMLPPGPVQYRTQAA